MFIFIGIFAWATQAFVTKILVTDMGFFSVYFFASLFTAVTAFLLYLLLDRGRSNFGFLKKPYRILSISVFLSITNFLLFASFGMTEATNVIVLLYIYPILMSIVDSITFKKRLTGREIVGLTLGFIGIFVFATGGNILAFRFVNPFVDMMVLVAAFTWALYLVIQKRYNFEEFSSNGVAFSLSAIYVLPLILIHLSFLSNGLVLPNLKVLTLLLYFSVVTFAIGNVVYVKGLKRTNIVNTALLTYLTPTIAVVLDFVFLGEGIYWYDLVPIMLVFVGYFILKSGKKQVLDSKIRGHI